MEFNINITNASSNESYHVTGATSQMWNESFCVTKYYRRWDLTCDTRSMYQPNHLNAHYRARVLMMLFAVHTKLLQSICASFRGNQLKPHHMKWILRTGVIQCFTRFSRIFQLQSNNWHFCVLFNATDWKMENDSKN